MVQSDLRYEFLHLLEKKANRLLFEMARLKGKAVCSALEDVHWKTKKTLALRLVKGDYSRWGTAVLSQILRHARL